MAQSHAHQPSRTLRGTWGEILAHSDEIPKTSEIELRVFELEAAGHRLLVPAIADYEARREPVRAGKIRGIARLNAFNEAEQGRLLSVSDTALLLGADLWARARNSGTATADPKELDGDVLIAAQALDTGLPPSDFVIATVNVGHLSLFVPADLWTNIRP